MHEPRKPMQNYSTLQEVIVDHEESGVLFHVAEPSRPRWNHIKDLDSFFIRMYQYHQNHGFFSMLVSGVLELIQFAFVVFLATFIVHGIDYAMIAGERVPATAANATGFRLTIPDIVLPISEWSETFTALTYIFLFGAAIVWLFQLIKGVFRMIDYWDIQQFYNTALTIPDCELENLTWYDVLMKVRAVQAEQQMCIHKKDLTELDIYHRILRQENYFIAMTNKQLIPPKFKVPYVGEMVYWTDALRFNMTMLLFWGPWAPFDNWDLREEYRKQNMRHELARKLGQRVLWCALLNLIFSPFILTWQCLYTFFSYAELVRREPGTLALRNWSLYGKLYFRHFNELDHELHARLCRAHRAGCRYLSSFTSQMTIIIARSLLFYVGAIFAVLVCLTFWSENVLSIEHVVTLIPTTFMAAAILRSLIPDETQVFAPEDLLATVLKHTHYLPVGWRGKAHTIQIRTEFQQLLQYKMVALLELLISPIMTPYVLWKYIFPRSLDIVDFFRNFTVSVVGVGDVCSFAQMDVRRHGNPDWHDTDAATPVDQYKQAEDGKTELSLVHFKFMNPTWVPPPESLLFVAELERQNVPVFHQNSGDFMSRPDTIDSSTNRFAWKSEGPRSTKTDDMNVSTMHLHDRYERQMGNRSRRTAEESTPLLFDR